MKYVLLIYQGKDYTPTSLSPEDYRSVAKRYGAVNNTPNVRPVIASHQQASPVTLNLLVSTLPVFEKSRSRTLERTAPCRSNGLVWTGLVAEIFDNAETEFCQSFSIRDSFSFSDPSALDLQPESTHQITLGASKMPTPPSTMPALM